MVMGVMGMDGLRPYSRHCGESVATRDSAWHLRHAGINRNGVGG